jgi:hypothetical protein
MFVNAASQSRFLHYACPSFVRASFGRNDKFGVLCAKIWGALRESLGCFARS